MFANTPDFERTIPAYQAIQLAHMWANEADLELRSDIVARSNVTQAITTRTMLRNSSGEKLAEASGKGIGEQSVASGLFEAIEHAAIKFRIPGQNDPRLQEILPYNKQIERLDHAYTIARKLSPATPQDVLVFHELSDDLEAIPDSLCFYPRIVCDISMPISPDCGSLIPLSAYASNTGTAAGTSWADSVLHGLNEVIERDAESQFLLEKNMGSKSYETVGLSESDPLNDLFIELTGGYGQRGAIYKLNAVSGYVFCAASKPLTDEAELGFGASQHPRIALERALTELQQIQYSIAEGSTWEDNGGAKPGLLDSRPNMKKMSTRVFPIDTLADIWFDDLPEPSEKLPSPISQLRKNGYTAYVREVWSAYVGQSRIVVTQTIVPGLEGLNNLVFGRPVLPTGRLLSREIVNFLQQS